MFNYCNKNDFSLPIELLLKYNIIYSTDFLTIWFKTNDFIFVSINCFTNFVKIMTTVCEIDSKA